MISSKSFFAFRKLFGPTIQQIFDPLSIILSQVDFLKDMVLVVRLITLLGGIVVFKNLHLFSSNVSEYYLIISDFLGDLHPIRYYLHPSVPWNTKLCSFT